MEAKLEEERSIHFRELSNLTKDAERKERQCLEMQKDLDKLWQDKQELEFELSIERSIISAQHKQVLTKQADCEELQDGERGAQQLELLLQQTKTIISKLDQFHTGRSQESEKSPEKLSSLTPQDATQNLKKSASSLKSITECDSNLETNFASLRRQIDFTQESVREIESRRFNAERKAKYLESSMSDVQAKIQQKDQQLEEFQERISTLKLQISQKEEEFTKVLHDKLALENQIEELKKFLVKTEEELTQTNQRLIVGKMENESVKVRTASLQKDLESTHMTLLSMRYQKDTAERIVQQLTQVRMRVF